MIYKLAFDRRALKEWEKLGHTIRDQFKKKLAERPHAPHIPSARLSGRADRYKIKLRSSGYSLVYEVIDDKILLLIVTAGKRNDSEVYHHADMR
ncbi:type II toxin-antitoxin system RelE/ParE family toxin [Erwinia tracheiphila]|uniref:RelE toxin n=1 Tax=Erwinia tracheiphila TaxID=65700 RepID=A0A0M2KJV4_9GAMM|nr:type II toxin-antitoxin system RelE/ParE family toxin [Erwinia tracheiphila]AXF78226.1 type II toxin-antitoxin system RelE/ParE family toxin [Erwinia tracheiphila]EOS95576.1 stability protein [Erwinia tracheiphila PSU-1]KKF37291.1 RelE toxin [Erwinia tracheiphila]UIA83049.1 type II toxin-antitoxin system RelE/ParE family toxin [Erwinia tracheiphila]UIA88681.1 type II toxin-antitoxin system RelE/ParE family toxin [Erwinia tracheiphila]